MKMMYRGCLGIWLVVLITTFPGVSTALLYERGNNLIYDDVQNITWFDYAFDPGFDDWDVTEKWIEDLNYMGWEYWRAPSLYELLYLGHDEFRQSSKYSTGPFVNIGSGGEFYLTSSISGIDQKWAYSLAQDRILQTWPVASIYGVAVMEGDTIPTPEPGTFLLFGLGIISIMARKYYRWQ
ncbi:MAG: PEP-CTERM sorting domain-containing protein [Desulfobulbaceae bacterium]|nr:PEP-CTERM sorting domain-containing protein [Desulfobulbaceae bacterium]